MSAAEGVVHDFSTPAGRERYLAWLSDTAISDMPGGGAEGFCLRSHALDVVFSPDVTSIPEAAEIVEREAMSRGIEAPRRVVQTFLGEVCLRTTIVWWRHRGHHLRPNPEKEAGEWAALAEIAPQWTAAHRPTEGEA